LLGNVSDVQPIRSYLALADRYCNAMCGDARAADANACTVDPQDPLAAS
jgi:hypothetical protein